MGVLVGVAVSSMVGVSVVGVFVGVGDHIGLRRNPADVFVEVTSAEWDPHRDYALTPDGLWEASVAPTGHVS